MDCSKIYYTVLIKYFLFRDNTIRYKSERLRDEAEKLIKSRENKTVLAQHASNQNLNSRLHDVVLFRSELEVLRCKILYTFISILISSQISIITSKCLLLSYNLQNEINRNKRETADLKETRRQLQKALKETDGPLKVTSECLYHREGRRVCLLIFSKI